MRKTVPGAGRPAGGTGYPPGEPLPVLWQNDAFFGHRSPRIQSEEMALAEEQRKPQEWIEDLRGRIDGLRGYL